MIADESYSEEFLWSFDECVLKPTAISTLACIVISSDLIWIQSQRGAAFSKLNPSRESPLESGFSVLN